MFSYSIFTVNSSASQTSQSATHCVDNLLTNENEKCVFKQEFMSGFIQLPRNLEFILILRGTLIAIFFLTLMFNAVKVMNNCSKGL